MATKHRVSTQEFADWMASCGKRGATKAEMCTRFGWTLSSAEKRILTAGLPWAKHLRGPGDIEHQNARVYFAPGFAPVAPIPHVASAPKRSRPEGDAIETDSTLRTVVPSCKDYRFSLKPNETPTPVFSALRPGQYLDDKPRPWTAPR